MFFDLLKNLAVQVVLCVLHAVPASAPSSCPTGGFFFAHGRNMVNDHALRGHVFANFTASEPIRCFRACRANCRCISFNYQQSGSEENCQLNDENRYTNSSALEFAEGWEYYDLVIDYNVRADVPFLDCQNGCCGSNPCLNGGTCHESCDVKGKRFTCDCGSRATGKLCETAICSTPDWRRYENSCFKVFTEKIFWIDAQASCVNESSNLTSIHSDDENYFVLQLANMAGLDHLWIGLSNLVNYSKDGSYQWVDGSNSNYTNWSAGEPNNVGNIENCTEMRVHPGEWNDLSCDQIHRLEYVCGKNFTDP